MSTIFEILIFGFWGVFLMEIKFFQFFLMRRFIKGLVYNFNRGGDGVLKFVGIMRGPWGPMGGPMGPHGPPPGPHGPPGRWALGPMGSGAHGLRGPRAPGAHGAPGGNILNLGPHGPHGAPNFECSPPRAVVRTHYSGAPTSSLLWNDL